MGRQGKGRGTPAEGKGTPGEATYVHEFSFFNELCVQGVQIDNRLRPTAGILRGSAIGKSVAEARAPAQAALGIPGDLRLRGQSARRGVGFLHF